MALTLDWKEVHFWTRGTEYPDSARVTEAVDPGDVIAPSVVAGSEGLYSKNGGDGCAIALTRAIGPRRTVSCIREGELDLGSAIQSLVPGAGVFATPGGVLTDVATSNKRVGTVITVQGHAPTGNNRSRKILRVEI